MAATRDIVATYRNPARVVQRMLGSGVREDRTLIYLMIGCLMVFVAQTPRLARQAHLTGEDLPMLMGATLLAWMFIAPLVFYLLAGLAHLVAKIGGRKQEPHGARLALFWALLASSPLILLWGLTAGFIGHGIQMTAVGILWFCMFMWFWIGGMIGAGRVQE